jgi:D-Tyr-tRNAtyr deacylase
MISISLVDFIGKLDDGVAVILSMMIKDKSYEIMYWFNKNNNYRIVIDDEFYKDFPNVKNIYEYPNLKDLILHIDQKVLPKREEIWKEFLQ